ncbi:hypothetical protein GUJ93_ZPchr0012g18803 [Zizania palustris]|uniref:Uncharacterized protein n=1 Tax=Zizania palustris TaxID=103762 RepID=A0A8J6BUJ5_ZIZPA|nr:hypothetical protein GUJ93_ZPchr0012g18803 [Zizania palustris]
MQRLLPESSLGREPYLRREGEPSVRGGDPTTARRTPTALETSPRARGGAQAGRDAPCGENARGAGRVASSGRRE